MTTAAEFVDSLATGGRYHFTTEEAARAIGSSLPAVQAALHRLKGDGVVADPYRGFHVIVPYQYRNFGCLPPEQFIPQLMEHLGLEYHVALLTAAAHFGAAHQSPQAFQVMVKTPRRSLECGRNVIHFVARKDLEQTPLETIATPRGPCLVSTREATALELVGYADQCAGLSNVATVLAELSEDLDVGRLRAAVPLYPIAWVQRLGYLLEFVQADLDTTPLADFVKTHARAFAPLVRAHQRSGVPRDSRWKLLINAEIEADL
jgi:predicted transcriptional regulator of viral defense system